MQEVIHFMVGDFFMKKYKKYTKYRKYKISEDKEDE